MKVLTDWHSCPPPCAGEWLVRKRNETKLIFVNPSKWDYESEWRGLAFNPKTAFVHEVKMVLDETEIAAADMMLIEEFTR